MLQGVGNLGGLYALQYVFGVLFVRGDAMLREKLLALLLDLGGGVTVADDPSPAVTYEFDRLDLQVLVLAGLHEDRGLFAAHLLARYLEVRWR